MKTESGIEALCRRIIEEGIRARERRAWLRGATYGYAYGTGETRKVPEFIAERNPYGSKL